MGDLVTLKFKVQVVNKVKVNRKQGTIFFVNNIAACFIKSLDGSICMQQHSLAATSDLPGFQSTFFGVRKMKL